MATKVTFSKAASVREKFSVSTAERAQQLIDITLSKTDARLRDYFEKRLAAGEDPYPPPTRQVQLVVLSAEDFASGNDPEAQAVWQKLSSSSPDGALLLKELAAALKDAGFVATVAIDDRTRSVSITVSDPNFVNWLRGHDVDKAATDVVQARLVKETAKVLTPVYELLIKDALRALAKEPGKVGHKTVDVRNEPRLAALEHELGARIAAAAIEKVMKGVDPEVASAYHDFGYDRIVVSVTFYGDPDKKKLLKAIGD